MMEINEIEQNLKSINEILTSFDKANSNRDEYEIGYNIFDIISKNYHHENYHSQILFSLLNPNSKHNDGSKYLNEFISYINKVLIHNNRQSNLSINKYENCNVTIEQPIEENDSTRRIDILIVSDSNKALIIENKINNAQDMDNQIPAYYNWCEAQKYTVEGIIYLTLDGKKRVDESTWKVNEDLKNTITKKLIYLNAYDINEQKSDLYHGWLQKCIELSGQNYTVNVILQQYSQLLKHLRKHIMEESQIKVLYERISIDSGLGESINLLQKLITILPQYYAKRIDEEINEIKPFNSKFTEDNGVIFEFLPKTKYCMFVHLRTSNQIEYSIDITIFDRDAQKYLFDEKLKGFYEKFSFERKSDCWIWNKVFSSINELIGNESAIILLIKDMFSELNDLDFQ